MKGAIMRKMMEEYEDHSEGNTGDHTESLKTLDEKALNDNDLVTGVEARLRNLNEITKEADDSADYEDDEDDSTPPVPDDDADEDDGEAEESEESGESTPDEDGEGDIQIPEAYVRAAIHQGWKEKDIDNLVKYNPELAMTTLTSCYNSTNNAIKEWSALGRAKIDQEREAETSKTNTSPDIDPLINKLKEKYDIEADDPLIEAVVKTLQLKQPEQKQQTDPRDLYATATARANASANASTDARVASFFGSEVMKPYEEFYGKLGLSQTIGDLTNGQQEHRLAVMEEAEQILTGMRMRGLNPTIEEVLEKAHLVVTEPIREQIIIGEIKKTAKQREKGMTFKPSKHKKSGGSIDTKSQKPKNRKELIEKVNQKMASISGFRS